MDYTIHPFEGVGAVKFGMTPQQIHEIWGEPEGTLLADPKFYRDHTDFYCKSEVQIRYSESGVCEHISLDGYVTDDSWNTTEEDDEYDSYEDTLQYDHTSGELNISIEDKMDYDKHDRMGFDNSNTFVGTSAHSDSLDQAIRPAFQGQELCDKTMGELKSWFKGLSTAIQYTDTGLIFLKFGIGVHSSHYFSPRWDPDCPVETVTISSSEYADMWSSNCLMKYGFPREEAITLS
jgi:hypothetical protein